MDLSPASTYRSSITPDNDRQEAIRDRAYQIWEESGFVHGRDQEQWRQAEDEIIGASPSDPVSENVTQISGHHRDGISDLPTGG